MSVLQTLNKLIFYYRYLVIAKAVWYKFRRNSKTSAVVCIVVWILPLPLLLAMQFNPYMQIYGYILTFIFLLPFPLFIFFLFGTIKALSGAHRVPADEKRRIVAILVAVLLIYTILFLPIIILFLVDDSLTLQTVGSICIYMSPLADTILYLLIRKSLLDKVLASLCFCKMSDGQETSSMENDSMIVPSTDPVWSVRGFRSDFRLIWVCCVSGLINLKQTAGINRN